VNFFELLGFSSDEMADTMPEKIVQVSNIYQEQAMKTQAAASQSAADGFDGFLLHFEARNVNLCNV